VIHAVRLIEELRTRDADMDGDVRSLLRQLDHWVIFTPPSGLWQRMTKLPFVLAVQGQQ
jgi:hypothetical protein